MIEGLQGTEASYYTVYIYHINCSEYSRHPSFSPLMTVRPLGHWPVKKFSETKCKEIESIQLNLILLKSIRGEKLGTNVLLGFQTLRITSHM